MLSRQTDRPIQKMLAKRLFWEQTNRQTYSKVCFENRQTDRPIQKMLSNVCFENRQTDRPIQKMLANVCFENRQTDRPIQKMLATDKQTDLSKDVLRTDKQTDLFKRCWLNVCFENRQTDRPIQKMLQIAPPPLLPSGERYGIMVELIWTNWTNTGLKKYTKHHFIKHWTYYCMYLESVPTGKASIFCWNILLLYYYYIEGATVGKYDYRLRQFLKLGRRCIIVRGRN